GTGSIHRATARAAPPAQSASAPASPRARRRPGHEATALELERHDLPAALLERLRHAMLAVEAREEQEASAPARARRLAAHRALAGSEAVELVHAAVRDAVVEPLLVLPRLVQQLAHRVHPTEQERLLHLERLGLEPVEGLHHRRPAFAEGGGLALDDVRRLAGLGPVAKEERGLPPVEENGLRAPGGYHPPAAVVRGRVTEAS